MNDNKPTTREKASSQVPATIDRSRLITEFQLANTTEAISGYRQMLESMLEVYGRASNKRQMLKDEMFQSLQSWLKSQLSLNQNTGVAEQLAAPVKTKISAMIESLVNNEHDKFEELFRETAQLINSNLFKNQVSLIFEDKHKQEMQKSAIASLQSNQRKKTIALNILEKLVAPRQYQQIKKALDTSKNYGEINSLINNAIANSQLKVPGVDSLEDINYMVDDVFLDENKDQSTFGKISRQLGLDKITGLSRLPLSIRSAKIFATAATKIGIEKRHLRQIQHFTLDTLLRNIKNDNVMSKVPAQTKANLMKLKRFLSESRVSTFQTEFIAAINSNDKLSETAKQELKLMARDLKSLPLELLILATFDNVSGVTKYDFIGQRLITFYRAARIWPRFMKGHLFQASHVNAGRTLAYASSETIRNATTTEKAFNQTKKLVSKIPDIDNLQSSNLNSKDINKKMGQFSQYIEDFNQKALSQEKHLLEKLSQAADETSRTKISEELTNHRAAHAKAQSHFSSYTAAFDEASRLKTSGTSLSKTVAGQQTDTLLKTTAEDMDKISSQQVTKSQVRKTGEEIVEEIRYGAIKRVGMAGVVGGVVGLPHLLDATSGNSSISKIGVSVGETVGMFVPVLGTILTFTQVFRGQTLAGDKLSGWERVTTAGFGLLQLGTDVLTLFGGVGVGLRAALVGSKLGTGAAKVAHASSKAPILARVGNKIGHIIGNRVNTANKLYDKANDLNKLVDASQPLTALARTKETFKQGWRGFTEGSSHFGKNLQGFNRLGRAWTHPRAYINAPNVFHAAAFLPAAASSVLGLGYRIPRAIYRASKTALEPIMKGIRVVRRGINNKVATALTAGLGVNKAAVQAGAKAFEKFQDVNAQVVALTHRRAQIERQLLAIFKKPNGTPYTNYETLAKALNMNNRKLSKHANQDFKALRNNNLGLINEAKELTATVLKHRKDLTKLSNIANKDELKVFTHLAKNNTTSNYAKLADKLINSGSVGLKVLNAAEKTLLTTLGISIGLPLINHGTFSGTWKAAGNAATGTLDAAYESGKYAFSGERKEQRKRWYERVDEVSSNVSKLNLFKRRLLQMNINELAKLYFKGLNNRSLEAELLSVISMRGYSEQQLQNAYYATGHKTQL